MFDFFKEMLDTQFGKYEVLPNAPKSKTQQSDKLLLDKISRLFIKIMGYSFFLIAAVSFYFAVRDKAWLDLIIKSIQVCIDIAVIVLLGKKTRKADLFAIGGAAVFFCSVYVTSFFIDF